MENTLVDPTTNTEAVKKAENSKVMMVFKQTETSSKRGREEQGYSTETITKNKFKLI